MPETLAFSTALLIGLLGSTHCLGMCGGIAASLGLKTPTQNFHPSLFLLAYNLGRISSYGLAGILMGSLGAALISAQGGLLLRSLAGLLLVSMGLYVSRWWTGLTRLESLGGYVWRYLRPLASRLMPARNPLQALALGAVWGWLPCGLVYSTLLWSAAAGSPEKSALLMLGFGLGTLPAMLITGVLAQQMQQLLKKRLTQQLAGTTLILLGLLTLPWQGWLQALS